MKAKYLVGLLTGGCMEDPIIKFNSPYEIIEANSKEEACKCYNKLHNCNYFYGCVMCSISCEKILDIHPDCSYNQCVKALKYIKNYGRPSIIN